MPSPAKSSLEPRAHGPSGTYGPSGTHGPTGSVWKFRHIIHPNRKPERIIYLKPGGKFLLFAGTADEVLAYWPNHSLQVLLS